jgi:hypothetical protein
LVGHEPLIFYKHKIDCLTFFNESIRMKGKSHAIEIFPPPPNLAKVKPLVAQQASV